MVGPISRTLCAALNRGTLGTIDTQPSTNAGDFYQNNPTNQYAKLIHANMADGKAYAFAFDDVGNFESLVNDGSPAVRRHHAEPASPAVAAPPRRRPSGNRVISNWNGKCIDVPSAELRRRRAAADLRLQQHHRPELDVHRRHAAHAEQQVHGRRLAAPPANGAVIQIATCSGNAAQQFVLSAAGDLVNPQANKCVDIQGWNGNDGAPLVLWDCVGGANQKWHRG